MAHPAQQLWHRPWVLALLMLAWLGGSALQLQQARLPAAPVSLAWLVAALAGWLCLGWLRRRVADQPARLALCCGAALCTALGALALTDLRAGWRLADALSPALEGQDLELHGVVAGLPRVSALGTHFDFEVSSARQAGQPVAVPDFIRLGWYQGWDGESLIASPPAPITVGDRWRLNVRLKRPHGLINPQGFDLELWLFERGVRATGSVRPGGQRIGSTWQHPLDQLRQRARDAILLRVTDKTAAGVLAALAVGDQAAIERDDWDLFRVTGVAHLMSISGLHVTMFAWLAAALVGRLWRAWPSAMRAWPAPDAARWGGLLLATVYALLAGWGVPAQRTVLMLAVVASLRSLGLRWPWPLVWLSAGTAVAVLDPWALLQPGFWLSFVAVGLLMASEPALTAKPSSASNPPPRHWRSVLGAGLRTQAVATIGLAPLSMVFFQQISVVGALANLLAIPWVTLVVTPLALLGLLAPPLWQLGAWAVQGLMAVLTWFSAWPLATWSAAAAPAWAMAAGLLGSALLIMPLPVRLRWLGVPMLLPLLAPLPERPPQGEVHIVAADIGQGTAVLVRTRNHLLLYDAGPRYSPESDAAGRVLLPLLRARGDSVIDLLVLSHRDTDHIGGAQTLLKGIPVKASLSSLESEHPLRQGLPQHRRCEAGQRWVWDGVQFEVLHPRAQDHARGLKPNGLSCVLKVSDTHGPRLLLTGDIEAEQEAELLARLPAAQLSVPLLMLPHHGSQTSSSAAFLDAVSPGVAIAQAAYRSRFGHPAQGVQERLRSRDIRLVRSDTCGAWSWPSAAAPGTAAEGSAPALPRVDPGICERDRTRRYWHHPGAP